MNNRTIYFIICVLSILTLLPEISLSGQKEGETMTIVIDAGHGGHDPGALGSHAKEKNINLEIALKLGNLIQKNLKNIKIIYTRDRDNFVELYRRAEIANKNKADLFISIHCNATRNRNLKGSETYIMGLHRSKANLEIAKLENASILLESDYKASYEGFDPNSDESYIIFSLNQDLNLERSTALAAAIQGQLTGRVGMVDRGVRQAGFLVLYKTTMPSILVETGYISNDADEKFLSSDQGQDYIVSAIYRAFREYTGLDHKQEMARPDPFTDSTVKPAEQLTVKSSDTVLSKKSEHKPKAVPVTVKEQPDKPSEAKSGQNTEFRIQVATSPKPLSQDDKIYKKFKTVQMYRQGNLYKYTVGNFQEKEKALEMLKSVRERGFPDAFLVVFRNGERIAQSEADQILQK